MNCESGETGKHIALKPRRLWACGFDSRLSHQNNTPTGESGGRTSNPACGGLTPSRGASNKKCFLMLDKMQ
jgi:hypothetical protein